MRFKGLIALLRDTLIKLGVIGAVFYLDQPVSNSGQLKARIHEVSWPIPVTVEITRSPDTLLKKLPCVVTGDSVILDECAGWFNLTAYILNQTGLSRRLTRLIQLNGETKP